MKELFFELIWISLGHKKRFDIPPASDEWEGLFFEAQRQTLVGVAFTGVERLPEEQRPGKELLLRWYSYVVKIEERNRLMNGMCGKVCRRFEDDGFHATVLKGQGNAAMYPDPLRRQSGDIDLWTVPKDCSKGRYDSLDNIRRVVEYVHRYAPGTEVRYHHVDFPVVKDVPIEVHYRPSYMFAPWHNRRMQKFFDHYVKESEKLEDGYKRPGWTMNVVFQMSHVFKHLFDEGIGLRQILDFYYLLQQNHECEHNELSQLLSSMGLGRFSRAMMYVMERVFGLEKDKMIVDPDEKCGEFLLNEIMMTGNFGYYDTRHSDLANESDAHHFVRKTGRNLKMVRYFPSEALFEPIFRIYHWTWRIWMRWRLKRRKNK